MIAINTSAGTIVVELNETEAPATAKNFQQYVEEGFYNGTIFHRVIPNFMIQGGGMDTDMREQKTREPIANEADNGLKNLRGTIAMARTQDPHSATAQFFVNLKDNDFLDHRSKDMMGWGYTVFGKVVEGMEIVDKIAGVATGSRGMHQDVPKDSIVIETAEVV
jgi:peptidyl-prolyl cis-trans isomerase B (cyclophilin B)